MSDNNVVEVVPEEVKEKVVEEVKEKVVEDVPEVENKSDMPPKKKETGNREATTPVITNPEPVENTLSVANPKVNKKLSAMSKNTKEKQKNRRLPKPTVSRGNSKGFSLDINPMYLFGLLGVIIAGASLWYQRKSFLKEEESDSGDNQSPVQSTGETETPRSAKKQSPPPKTLGTAKRQHDPWAYQREHQQTGIGPLGTDASFGRFPGNYDFD